MQSSQALSLQKANLTGTGRKSTTQVCCVKPAGALHSQWKFLIVLKSDTGRLDLKEGKVRGCLALIDIFIYELKTRHGILHSRNA